MVTTKLYVEGGGDSESLRSLCRAGFRTFLETAGFSGRMPRIVACGGGSDAIDRFFTARRMKEPALLLIDSEHPVIDQSPWQHLARHSSLQHVLRVRTSDEHCHLMVVCMESWLLADAATLRRFFGDGFNDRPLLSLTNIEAVTVDGVMRILKKSTHRCIHGVRSVKGETSFRLLMLVDPRKVAAASPWAARFLRALDAAMPSQSRLS